MSDNKKDQSAGIKKNVKVNSFIVDEKSSWSSNKFKTLMVMFFFIIPLSLMILMSASIYLVNEFFSNTYSGSKKLSFNENVQSQINKSINQKDVETFLTLYKHTEAKTFNEKMDIVLKEYNKTRPVYSVNNKDADFNKDVRKVSWELGQSMWNIQYPNFSDKASSYYSKMGMSNNFIDYMRSRFFVEKSNIVSMDNYVPKLVLVKSSENIQRIIDKALNKNDFEELIYLVQQVNLYLGYPDTISEYFIGTVNNYAFGLLNILKLSSDSLENTLGYDYIMLADKNKTVTMKEGTIGITKKDVYLGRMWSALMKD